MSAVGGGAGPLAGFRVLELATHLPGPLCGLLLADLGAEVTKVEPPTGDPMRRIDARRFAAVNRGKRSVCVDLRTPAGQAALRALVAHSDGLLEGNRPAVAERLGVTYAALRPVQPALVLASLTGYGQSGPLRDWPGHDLNFAGLGGALTAGGEPRELKGLYLGDIFGGLYAAVTLVAALHRARATGRGCHIDLALSEAVAAALSPYFCNTLNPDPAAVVIEAAAGYGVFRGGDGAAFTLAAFEDRLWAELCQALGRGDLQALPQAERVDPERAAALNAELQQIFAQRDAAAWLSLLGARSLPVAPVRSVAAFAEDPQFSARQLLVQVPSGFRHIRFPALLDGQPLPLGADAPALGQHTAETLREAGLP